MVANKEEYMTATKKIMAGFMTIIVLLAIIGTSLVISFSNVTYKYIIDTLGLDLIDYTEGQEVAFSSSDYRSISKLYDMSNWEDSDYYIFNGIIYDNTTYDNDKALIDAIVADNKSGRENAVELKANFSNKNLSFTNLTLNNVDGFSVIYNNVTLSSTWNVSSTIFTDYANMNLREVMFKDATDNSGFTVNGQTAYIDVIRLTADNNDYVWGVSHQITLKEIINGAISLNLATKEEIFTSETVNLSGLRITFESPTNTAVA